MGRWKYMTVALTKGMDEGTTGQDGRPGQDGRQEADAMLLNCEFGLDGAIRGRPGYTRQTGFGKRLLSAGFPVVDAPDGGVANLTATGYVPTALFKHRDAQSERPVLAAQGRAWEWEADSGVQRWVDLLGWAGAKRVRGPDLAHMPNTVSGFAHTVDNTSPVSWNMAIQPGTKTAVLTSDAGEIEGTWNVAGVTPDTLGQTAAAYHVSSKTSCLVYVTSTNQIRMVRRVAGSYTPVDTLLASNAATTAIASVCCDFDGAVFWVVYATTTARQFALLRVDVAAGTVLTTVTKTYGGTDTIRGIWVSNSNVATNRVVVFGGITGAAGGPLSDVFNATTLADLGLQTKHAGTTVTADINQRMSVTCGAVVGTHCWCAWQDTTTGLTYLSYLDITTAAAQAPKPYWWNGPNTTVCENTYLPNHFPAFQPVVVGGRTYVGISATRELSSNGAANRLTGVQGNAATWYVLDITDVNDMNGNSFPLGTLRNPTIVARGTLDASVPAYQPFHAMTDGVELRFGGAEWRNFTIGNVVFANTKTTVVLGLDPALTTNRVIPFAPSSDLIGAGTITAGSVPHQFAGGACTEVGFPYLEYPRASAVKSAGGVLAAGDYTVAACWRWVDAGGQVHRSAPSLSWTATVVLNDKITITCTTPQMTEREDTVYLDFYCTAVNPGAGATLFYQGSQVFVPSTGGGSSLTFAITAVDTTNGLGAPLYTLGGVLDNHPADMSGGLAAVGRRAWTSDGVALYPSKYLVPGRGPAWSQAGLVVNLPNPAGRVVALAALDYRLIAFCERGIYAVEGDGPSDSLAGVDFTTPVRVAGLGIAGPRSYATTPKGILFHAANTALISMAGGTADPLSGGLWFLDRGGQLHNVGREINAEVGNTPCEMAYSHEKDTVYVRSGTGTILAWNGRGNRWTKWNTPVGKRSFASFNVPGSSGSKHLDVTAVTPGPLVINLFNDAEAGPNNPTITDGVLTETLSSGATTTFNQVLAAINGQSAQITAVMVGSGTNHFPGVNWTGSLTGGTLNSAVSLAAVNGALWLVCDEPGVYNSSPGVDTDVTSNSYSMQVKTPHFYADGESGTGWARIRSVKLLGELPVGYQLTVDALFDGEVAYTSGPITVSAGLGALSWPTSRHAPTWRLPSQKCSQVQFTLTANPAYAGVVWTEMVIEYMPLSGHAPDGQRF